MNKLIELIKEADKILVTSHISPDPDAVSSSLLAYGTLKANFPDKKVRLVFEETPSQDLSFLADYADINYQNLADFMENEPPQLLIIVDANKFDRVSRNDGDKIKQLVEQNAIKTVVIDHHEPDDKSQTDVYINSGYPAAAQEVYHTLFDQLNLSKPEGYAQTTMVGLLSDTLRFKYHNPKHRETFKLVSELIDAGVDIEALENQMETYTQSHLDVVAHLIGNLRVGNGYNFSFISDEFIDKWQADAKEMDDLKSGGSIFVNQFIRNIEPNKWGFVVSRETVPSDKNYSVSLRSESGVKDVSTIAKHLGGGGHKPSAGAKFHAGSVKEAVDKVLATIAESESS